MKSKLLIYALPVLLLSFLIYGYSRQDNPNTDSAPLNDASSNVQSVNTVQGDTLYTFIVPNELILGVNKMANSPRFAFTSGGQSSAITTDNIWIRTDLRGNRIDSFPQINNTVGQGFGFRDLAWDGKYLLTSDNNTIRRIDTVTFTEPRPGITGPNNPNRGLAWSSVNRIWTSNFTTGPVAMIDTNGATVKSLGIPTVAPYGLGADKWTSPNKMWLWYTEPSTAGTIRLSKVDTATGTIVRSFTYNFGAVASSGGLDIFNNHPSYPGRVVAIMVVQNSPASVAAVIDLGPDSSSVGPPPVGNTLVLVHDSVNTPTVQRTADRDTLLVYLHQYVGSYTMRSFDTTTTLGDLSSYNTIILQETSFDTPVLRWLGAIARGQIKTWLGTGTPTSKKSLISIGADLGYNYSRTGSGAIDMEYSQTFGKYIYRVDNAPGSTSPAVIGVGIDVGNSRPLSSAPPGGSYWPDGCSIDAGGSTVLYKYQNHSAADTVAGIGNVQSGYVVASLFQDPRYFTDGFRNVFASTIAWVVANGGLITGTGHNNFTGVINDYKLLQNYPNPFNPSTKIAYTIPKSGMVTLKLYDILGKEVATLVNEIKSPGNYEVQFNGANYASGTYFYRIQSGNFIETKKMLLMK